MDVVAHQVKLVMAFAIGWMNSKLGRRQGEDKPASACVYRRQAKHVREERTDLVGLRENTIACIPVITLRS